MSCVYNPQIGVVDFVISSFLVLGFLAGASQKSKKMSALHPHYKYYFSGMAFKLFAVISFLLIFIYYYNGGDTLSYHKGAIAMKNLFFSSPGRYFDLLLNPITVEKYYNYFNPETCYPPTWMVKKEANFTVIRVASIFQIFLGNSVVAPNIIFARLAYTPLFKLYELVCSYFPEKGTILRYAILFTPSVAFWGSGIMKDTIAVTGICWLVVMFEKVAIQKVRISISRFAIIAFSAMAIYQVKSYLLLALIPGMIVWFNFQRVSRIKSGFVKAVLFPAFGIGSFFGFLYLYTTYGELFGIYSADSIFVEAAIIQQDLLREEAYGTNSFNIGTFEPTLAGVTGKIPKALEAGLFRPYLWESGGSPTMVLSGIENAIILFMLIVGLFRRKIFGFFGNTFSHPFLILSLIFTLFLAFSIGLTSANFGALVRYKIPLMPFFMTILILNYSRGKSEYIAK